MLNIYKACCSNLKEIERSQIQLKRMFNNAVLNNRKQEIQTLTMMYAMLYSTYAEVALLKMIHTPYGFNNDYTIQIQRQKNIEAKWNKCIELAFLPISTKANIGQIQNKKKYLQQILDLYIIKPSMVRNKIAHGQWSIALNSDNTAINKDMTQTISSQDFVKIDILFSIHQKFLKCIEDLIESTNTHYRDYYTIIDELENHIAKTKFWNFESRFKRIKNTKKVYKKN